MNENADVNPGVNEDDVEGHMPFKRGAHDETAEQAGSDDAEGHAFRGRGAHEEPEDGDDTEGHGARFNG